MVGHSTYKTFLMTSKDGMAWEKLVDIKDYPKLGDTPELIDVTTLSHGSYVYVPGLQKSEALAFKANHTKEDYEKLVAIKGEQWFAVWFGGTDAVPSVPNGEWGKWKFKASLSVSIAEGSVNSPADMSISLIPSTEVQYDSEVV